jgi:hypothetical protein
LYINKKENIIERRIEAITDFSKPIFIVQRLENEGDHDLGHAMFSFAINNLEEKLIGSCIGGCRGVEIGKLHTVLKTGIDVNPPDSVIFIDGFTKAVEYGKNPSGQQVTMIFDVKKLLPTFKEVDFTMEEAQLNKLKQTYPNELISKDEKNIWLTRLPKDDRRIATSYEREYARWIPNKQMDALKAIFVCGIDVDATKYFVLETIKDL